MLFSKTMSTKKKKIFRGKHDRNKETALYRVTVYWLLFIPVYSKQELID
jgi:hypothetical protein